MQIGKVIGTMVANRKDARLEGLKFLLVRPVDVDLSELDGCLLAVDVVGSGVGEYVLYTSGSSARQNEETNKRPVDAIIMAIIDRWDVEGRLVYHKFLGPAQLAHAG